MDTRAYGAAKALKILGNLDKEVAKEIKKSMGDAVKPVISAAKTDAPARPLSGWGQWTTPAGRDLSYDSGTVKRGIKKVQRTTGEKRNGRYSRTIPLLELRNQSAAGAIYELAGARNNNTFTRNIERKHGASPRLLYKAWDARSQRVTASVARDVQRLEAEVTRRLAR